MKVPTIVSVLIAIQISRALAIVGGRDAKEPPPDEPVIFLPNARVEGLRKDSNGLYSFLGIRYAEPPTGGNRFWRPIYKRLAGDVNATTHGPPCPQPDPTGAGKFVGNEDCLLLNVFTPQMPDESTGLPVIVWIHGGGFRFGSASQYGPDPLTDNNVIVVPIQYRLGTLGILGTGRKEFPGNLALLDCVVAVQWIFDYISFFGGDPYNLKVMGHGSGAVTAMHLAHSQMSRSFIRGVIAMSGTALAQYSMETLPRIAVTQVSTLNGCPSEGPVSIIQCMKKKSIADLIETDTKIQFQRLSGKSVGASLTGFVSFLPYIEEVDDDRGLPGFLTEDPHDSVKEGHYPEIPILLGSTQDETANGLNVDSIRNGWGGFDNFLSNISRSLGLENFLKPLQKPLTLGLPSLNDYLTIPVDMNPIEVLRKLTEITTDALFNLPMVLVADAWSKWAPSFIYQFSYVSHPDTSKGKNFLGHLPLVSSHTNTDTNAVAHGDELAFLFDVQDLFGHPIKNRTHPHARDLRMREAFSKLITDFAALRPAQNEDLGGSFTKRFATKGSSFIKLEQGIEIGQDFRFCTLSLWGAALESLKGMTCNYLADTVKQLNLIASDLPTENNTLTKHLSGLGLGKGPTSLLKL